MTSFKDLFSGHAQSYAVFRPRYPHDLFEYLASICQSRQAVWDCGAGNGQASVALAEFFDHIIATDPSDKQLAAAEKNPRVEYVQGPAERSGLADASVDLITVAQAFHWFKHAEFYGEVRRVLKPGGVLAIWSYNLCEISPEVDAQVKKLYSDILGSYWEFERKSVEAAYRDIEIPFKEVPSPSFEMKASWSLEQLIGYLGTWSSLQTYQKKNGSNPLELIFPDLKRAWGETPTREVRWPLSVRIFRV